MRCRRSRLFILAVGVFLIGTAIIGYKVHQLRGLILKAPGHIREAILYDTSNNIIKETVSKLRASLDPRHELIRHVVMNHDGVAPVKKLVKNVKDFHNASLAEKVNMLKKLESKGKAVLGIGEKGNKDLNIEKIVTKEHKVKRSTETAGDRKAAVPAQSKLTKEELWQQIRRGVDPQVAPMLYSLDMPTFKCTDGRLQINMSAVNDDYCDCLDGSDEPGTSACANGKFFCAVERKYIPSSDVNDGICHCCDGSDEWKNLSPIGFHLPLHSFKRYTPCTCRCGQ